jgi:hypothetical protein
MGMFSVRGRLSRPAGHKSPDRPHPDFRLARIVALPGRLALAARAAIRNTANEATSGLRDVRLAMVAATDDARIVAVLLLLAAVALGLEMAASFHLI